MSINELNVIKEKFKEVNGDTYSMVRIYNLSHHLTAEQEKAILQAASDKSAKSSMIIQFILSTGIRLDELVNLRYEDIDTSRSVVMIRSRETSKHITAWKPRYKYGIRNIETNDMMLRMLKVNDLGKNRYLFSAKNDGIRQYTKPAIINMIKTAVKNSGLEIGFSVSTNILRITYALNAVKQGVPIRTVSTNLGHKSVIITLSWIFDSQIIRSVKRENPLYKVNIDDR